MSSFSTRSRSTVPVALLFSAALLASSASAQVASYSFTQEQGTWQPIAGNGTPLGYTGGGFAAIDDNAFLIEGDDIAFGLQNFGNGWPIGFTFHFNGVAYDRVGFSTEGWLAFGQSFNGTHAVYLPIGNDAAFKPLSTATAEGVDPALRNRVVAFGNDLRAMDPGGTWPLQFLTLGTAPERTFVVEWNVASSGNVSGAQLSFQIRLAEGGGDPAAQTVQVVYGAMSSPVAFTGQVGLSGMDETDFNNRSVTVTPYNWTTSDAGTTNDATCRIPAVGTNLPSGLTYTWTPPACTVSGVAVTDITASGTTASATLSWDAVAGATGYDYIVTTGTSTDPVVASGTGVTGTTVALSGLPRDVPLHVYVRATCSTPNAGWGQGVTFSAEDVLDVTCGTPPLQQTYCYVDNEVHTWHYISTAASSLRIIFSGGTLSNGDVLTIYDGPNDQGPVLFTSGLGGVITGQIANSTGPDLFMKLVADELSSCSNTTWIDPLAWEVGCLDCTPILADYEVTPDCANGQFSVNVTVFTMGTATSASITNNGGAPTVPVASMGSYVTGPFPVGTPVLVTVVNPVNGYCSSESTPLVNPPCPVVSCGPDNYTYCYMDNDASQWVYQSTGTERIGIRFLSGTVAPGDEIHVYNGADPFGSAVQFSGNNGGDLSGLLVTTTVASNTLMLEAHADGSGSCATGQGTPWNYVVACYDGCAQPQATYTVQDDCANGRFSVNVSVTVLGAASVNITNNGGAPAVSATAVGDYTVGPFTAGTPVVISVAGSSALCSTNSMALQDGCGVGIQERTFAPLRVVPNPSTGIFRVQLPQGFGTEAQVEVTDLTGRNLLRQRAQGRTNEFTLDLSYLPNGAYVLSVLEKDRRMTGMVQVVH